MQVRLLGPLEVDSNGGALSPGRSKQGIVLALLALRVGEVVAVDELIEAGWGDDLPSDPANALQYQVAQLRKLIEPEPGTPRCLQTAKPGYRLNGQTVTTDVQAFDAALAEARRATDAGDRARAAALIADGLALWRGPALAEFRYDGFAQAEAERLDDERLAAVELQLDIALDAGRHREVAPHLAKLTTEHPLREGLWQRRALALFGSGRQSEALRALQDARATLGEIGLEPGAELRDLERRIIDQDASLTPEPPSQARPQPPQAPAVPAPPPPQADNEGSSRTLPAPANRLIGRQTEVEAVNALLSAGRMVSLVGPGGAGKTRLAIAIGHELIRQSQGEVYFVSLEPLHDDDILAAAIGRVAGMRENPERPVLETLVDHFGSNRATLILDNCEHIVGPVADLVAVLLARCVNLSVLATSQVTLEAPGEAVFTLAPLSVPGQTGSIYDPIADVDAVVLFMERAGQAGAPVEQWDDADLAAVANIVTALDGMPLALELAAARTRSMTLEEIATGLGDRFTMLNRGPRTAPDRQRSLLGALQWSLGLLEEPQRLLMAKLSVFAGGFDAEDAAGVTGLAVSTIRDDLAELLDRSLLYRTPDVAGRARFAMFESLRQHGALELGAERLASVRQAHLRHFADFAVRADDGIRGPDQVDWLYRLDAANDNIRAALAWGLDDGSIELGIQLAASLGRYWDWRGLLKEGSSWAERLITGSTGPVPSLPSVRAWYAFMAWEFGDLEKARREHDLAVADALTLDDPLETIGIRSIRALLSRSDGDLAEARRQALETAEATEQAGDRWFLAWAESTLATVALAAGEIDEAEAHARKSTEQFAQLGDRRSQGWGLVALAQVALARGDFESAEQSGRAALDASSTSEDERNMLWALEVLTEAAHRQGQLERAARLWGAAGPIRSARGMAGPVSRLSPADQLGATLAAELGERFESLVDGGRSNPSATIEAELNGLVETDR